MLVYIALCDPTHYRTINTIPNLYALESTCSHIQVFIINKFPDVVVTSSWGHCTFEDEFDFSASTDSLWLPTSLVTELSETGCEPKFFSGNWEYKSSLNLNTQISPLPYCVFVLRFLGIRISCQRGMPGSNFQLNSLLFLTFSSLFFCPFLSS